MSGDGSQKGFLFPLKLQKREKKSKLYEHEIYC